MKTTVGELRTLIREVVEGASEANVQSKLEEFDKQIAEPLRGKLLKDFRLDDANIDGMSFQFYYAKSISPTKPYVVMVDGYEAGNFKLPEEAIAKAKKKYETKIRRDLKVKVDPAVKAAEIEAKAEKARLRDAAASWKNGHLSAMTDSNGKRFDPNKRFK